MPSVIFIEEGEHGGEDVHFQIPLSIIGAGRGKTTLRFGLKIEGKKSNGLVIKGLYDKYKQIVFEI